MKVDYANLQPSCFHPDTHLAAQTACSELLSSAVNNKQDTTTIINASLSIYADQIYRNAFKAGQFSLMLCVQAPLGGLSNNQADWFLILFGICFSINAALVEVKVYITNL